MKQSGNRISKAFELATEILQHNRQLLEETSQKLLQKETLSAEELPQPVWQDHTAVETDGNNHE